MGLKAVMGSKFVWKENRKEPGKFGLYHVVSKNDLRFIRNAVEGEIERTDLDVLYMEKEGRNICGKIRTCKISGNKIVEVYDDDKKVYLPYDLFMKQQEEYKTNPIVDDTTEEYKKKQKEYYTTHGKKTKEIKEIKEIKKIKEIKEDKSDDKKQDNISVLANTAKASIVIPGKIVIGDTIPLPDNTNTNINTKDKTDKSIRLPYMEIDYVYENLF